MMKRATLLLGFYSYLLLLGLFSSSLSADDGLKQQLFKHVNSNDPILAIPGNKQLSEPARIMAEAARNGDWKNPVFLGDESYDYVLYAYYNGIIDRHEFIEIQDYLQILTDFMTVETVGFRERSERIPAITIERLRPDDFQTGSLKALVNDTDLAILDTPSATPRTDKSGHWTTVVTVDPDFMKNYIENIEAIGPHCGGFKGDVSRCFKHFKIPQTELLMFWYKALTILLPTIHYIEENKIIIGSINHFLDSLPQNSDTPDFLPLYGQLDWDDLLEYRVNRQNAGTIYHPDSKSNYFTPHGIYGGASAFLRHDLVHHELINQIPENHRRFFSWLHRQEQSVIKRMDLEFFTMNQTGDDAIYSGVTKTDDSLLNQILKKTGEDEDHVPPLFETNEYFWPHGGKHGELFHGGFADMDILYDPAMQQYPDIALAETLIDAFTEQWSSVGFKFQTTFKVYTSYMLSLLRKHSMLIFEQFNIDIDTILTLIEQISTKTFIYPEGYPPPDSRFEFQEE